MGFGFSHFTDKQQINICLTEECVRTGESYLKYHLALIEEKAS
jgi:hypothetical protein